MAEAINTSSATSEASFWNNRYLSGDTGWDLGQVSPPLKSYIDQLENKNLRILIPGCGNTYEADYLLQQGFTDITVIDIAPTLVNALLEKFRSNQYIKILLGDFFEHKGQYDLILEQTFFCAIPPAMRKQYVNKMHSLLADNGKLCGLLFNRMFEKPGPPFGGNKEEYTDLFRDKFLFKTFDTCYNSFTKRHGNELFVILIKK